ncbi:MAG: ORF6N domain-containing protein [Flavobacteriaceae bacterium]|nr:ORF6N domain-containing protein [Flavobacteriaceae bacterium]
MNGKIAIPEEIITSKIYLIRNQKVMLDKDLAELYDVETKRLKEQVRRNIDRFPASFMFELTTEEYSSLRSQIATLKRGRHSKYPPFVFTEHGILMLSSVLNSELAIKMSVQIIETFIQLRKLANNYEEIMNKINQMESQNNEQFSEIYQVLQQLLEKPKEEPRIKIGYKKE